MKNPLLVVSLVLLLCFVFGCQNKTAMAELQQMKTVAAQQEQNKTLLRHQLEELDKENFAVMDETCAPDYKAYCPGNPKGISLEEHKTWYKSYPVAFPGYHHMIKDVFAEGNKAVLLGSLIGTHKGDFMGIPATGKPIDVSFIEIARFSEGKIAEVWIEADFLGLYQQLGMELKPKEAEKK
jgi:predicted ester cyclase